MKFISALFALLCLIVSCGPRDDESLLSGGGVSRNDFGLKSGQTLVAQKNNEKLSSCQAEDDPTWNTIRLFAEIENMFDQAGDLKVILGKGSRNCVKVSDQDPIQIVLQEASGSKNYNDSGFFYYVTKIEMRNTQDFLSNSKLVKEVAQGMHLTEAQLKEFMSHRGHDQITLTYLKKAGEKKQAEFKVPAGMTFSTEIDGTKLPSCRGDKDPTWSTLRVYQETLGTMSSLENLAVLVGKGSRNCVSVSSKQTVELVTQTSEDSNAFTKSGLFFKVTALEMMNTSDLLKQPETLNFVAMAMTMKLEDFKAYLSQENFPEVLTLTYVESSEEVVTPVTPLLEVYSLPEAKGKRVPACGESVVWSDIRVFPEQESLLSSALQNRTMKVLVSQGDRNCVPVGDTVPFTFKVEGQFQQDLTKQVRVTKIEIRDKQAVLKDTTLILGLAVQMGVEPADMEKMIQSYQRDKINVTYFEWVTQ